VSETPQEASATIESGLQVGHFVRADLMADERRNEELAIFQA